MSNQVEGQSVSPNDAKLNVSSSDSWGTWDCPICAAQHSDPDDIYETTCKNGHAVRLGIVEDGRRAAWL